MRHCLTFIPLGFLLLASCEPDGGSTPSEERNPDRNRKIGASIPHDAMSNAQISAQDSVGKPPMPRNLAVGVDDTCPLHHEKMTLNEIPIFFEEDLAGEVDLPIQPITEAFPFAAEKIFSPGNSLLPGEPRNAIVYQCSSCIKARKLAETGRKPAAPE